jgi:hypothetical protein
MVQEHDHGHEHHYQEIDGTENISAYEETTHHLITVQFHERGLSLTLNYEEAMELADAMQKIVGHIGQGRQRNGG